MKRETTGTEVESVQETQTMYEGRIIRLERSTVELPDGRTALREVVRHPGAASIAATTREGELLLVEQYRFATGGRHLELPAGKLEPGEDPKEAALRELKEETGFTARSIEHLHTFFTSPGFADERLFLFAADDLTEGDAQPDEDEWVHVIRASADDVRQWLASGVIQDAKTLVGCYWWLMGRSQERRPE